MSSRISIAAIIIAVVAIVAIFSITIFYHVNLFQANLFQEPAQQILSAILVAVIPIVGTPLLAYWIRQWNKPVLGFDGIIKAMDSYYLRVTMIKGEGTAKTCVGWYQVEDIIPQTRSVWRDSSKVRDIFKGARADLRLFYMTSEHPTSIVFPKIRAEEEVFNAETHERVIGTIKEQYDEYSQKMLCVIITADNVKEPFTWSKKISEIIQTAK